jgi:ankyrin repeat protein
MVRFLLERDADHTLRSPEGRTLFEIAQQKGHQTIADMLREIGS